jgi:hypothetical protein
VPFELIVTAHVREHVTELRNLDLPVLSELELLGDQQTLLSTRDGTLYTERIRVVAHHSGTITIAPVTLDAVDARDGKAKQYSSNSLTLVVGGGISAVARNFDITGALIAALRWFLVIAVVLVVVRLLRRRRKAPAVQVLPAAKPVAAPAPPARVTTREQRLRDARTVLAANRTRSAVLQVRTAVREMVGANDAETLADVLRRTNEDDRTMRRVLIALERAAFTHEDDFQAAVDDVLARLDEAAP